MALKAGREGVDSSQVDGRGKIKGIDIPIATPSKAGLLKPVAKTAGMTQPVGSDTDGKLFTALSGGTITKLMSANEITVNAEHDLSDAYTNYDIIVLIGSSTATNQRYIQAAAFPVDFLELNDGIGCANESVNLYLMIVSATRVKVMGSSFGTPRTMAIYGIKLK